MDYPLQPGDRLRLSRAGVVCYGGAWPHFVPQAQGGGTTGTVLFAGERPHWPGVAPRPYYVRWDNGTENSYRMEDLESAPDGTTEGPANVVPFRKPD